MDEGTAFLVQEALHQWMFGEPSSTEDWEPNPPKLEKLRVIQRISKECIDDMVQAIPKAVEGILQAKEKAIWRSQPLWTRVRDTILDKLGQ
jgi:predicted GTPase